MSKLAQIGSSALARIRRWAASPVFEDQVKTRTVALINVLMLAAAGVWPAFVALLAVFRVGHRVNLLIALASSLLLLGVRELMRRGRMVLAVALGTGLAWAAITSFLYNLGTVYSVHLAGYLLVVLIAAWLGGVRAGGAAYLLSIASVFVLARAETMGLLPPATRMPPLNLMINMAAYLAASICLLVLVRTNFMAALREAQAEITERIAARQENALLLRQIRERAAGLEETVAERTRELQAERDRTQVILETVGESVIVTDLDGQVLFANPATETLTGFSRDETLGQPIWRDWSAQVLRETWPQAQKALSSGQFWKGEVTGRRKDRAMYIVALTGTPLYDERAGAIPTGGVWVQRDITTIKEVERLKDQFVSNVSHEVRTPASIIMLSCDNLDAFYDRLDESQRRQMLQGIREQAHLLGSLVEDILTLSQIDSGRIAQARTRVDLACLVSEEVERQRLLAEGRSQRLSITAEVPVSVLGHEVQLRRVVRNLLDNAIKYTPAGGQITCTCEIRAAALAATPGAPSWPAGPWAVVEVADGGIGIPSTALPFLFERFYRVQAEGEVSGVGLGLPIARELAVLHGGWIDVASTPGQGSTFTVYLPLWDEKHLS